MPLDFSLVFYREEGFSCSRLICLVMSRFLRKHVQTKLLVYRDRGMSGRFNCEVKLTKIQYSNFAIGATSPYSQAPGTQGFNYMPAAPSSFNQNSLSGYQSQAPSMGLSQAGTLQWSPVDEFGSDVRRPTQATPSKPAATAAAVGLTRPTNVA